MKRYFMLISLTIVVVLSSGCVVVNRITHPLSYKEDWDSKLGKEVTLRGRPAGTYTNATICTTDGWNYSSFGMESTLFRIDGLADWPEQIEKGRGVIVTGILTKENSPEYGSEYVIKYPTWRLAWFW
jgi:hypothetical protein